jgi:hypothetical protein
MTHEAIIQGLYESLYAPLGSPVRAIDIVRDISLDLGGGTAAGASVALRINYGGVATWWGKPALPDLAGVVDGDRLCVLVVIRPSGTLCAYVAVHSDMYRLAVQALLEVPLEDPTAFDSLGGVLRWWGVALAHITDDDPAAKAEPGTVSFAWDWLLHGEDPKARNLRKALRSHLRKRFQSDLDDITTRFWLQPLLKVADYANRNDLGALSLACRAAKPHCSLLVRECERFIDTDRSGIIYEVWDEIERLHGEGELSELIHGLAVGLADALLYYRGCAEHHVKIPIRVWVGFAIEVLDGYHNMEGRP